MIYGRKRNNDDTRALHKRRGICRRVWEKELLRNLIFLAIGIVIGIVVFIFNKEFISIILSGVASAVCGYVFCIKDRYSRMSLLDSLIDMYKFSKSQKLYEYRRGR
ncbi:MAG: hypothetical protein ACLR3R_18530 [Clostridium paraputrificum]